MKKFFCVLSLLALLPLFSGCEISNSELANNLEGNMTRLVYSIGYLDSISVEDLSGLVNNSSYFTNSSLYAGNLNGNSNNDLENGLNNDLNNLNGVSFGGNISNYRDNNYRYRTYNNNNNISQTNNLNNVSSSNLSNTSLSNSVDLRLLESNAEDLNQILLDISQKRGIIMLYCTDIRTGRANLTNEDKVAINEYVLLLKEVTNYLNNTQGDLTGYFNNLSTISVNENSQEIVNAKLIRANELLKTRYAKLDTCMDALDAILYIMQSRATYDYVNMYNNNFDQNTQNNLDTNANLMTNDFGSTENGLINNNLSGNNLNNQTNNALNDNLNNQIDNIQNNDCCNNIDKNLTYNGNNNCCNGNCCNGNCCNRNLNGTTNLNNSQNLQNNLNNNLITENNTNNNINNTNNNLNGEANVGGTTTNNNINNQFDGNAFNQTNGMTKEEIVLNGGLVKGQNGDQVSKNPNSFVLNIVPEILTQEDAVELGVIVPENKDEVEKIMDETEHNSETKNNSYLGEDLYSETENQQPLAPHAELGMISLTPHNEDEKDILKLLPMK